MTDPLSNLIKSVSGLLETSDETSGEPDSTDDSPNTLYRRSYLGVFGASVIGVGGYMRAQGDSTVPSETVRYGYGGVPVTGGEKSSDSAVTGVTGPIKKDSRLVANDATSTDTSGQSAYMRQLPGRVQAQNFDSGGEGVSYHDADAENRFGAYRPDSGVDIQETSDSSGQYNIGAIWDDEWLEYTVRIPAGTYDISARVATKSSDRQLRFLLDGSELGTLELPVTGDYQNWETATLTGVSVETDGEHVLRVESVGGDFNLNWFEVSESDSTVTATSTPTPSQTATPTPTPSQTATPTPTPSQTATPTPTPSQTATPTPTPSQTATPTPTPTATDLDEYGVQGYGEDGYGG